MEPLITASVLLVVAGMALAANWKLKQKVKLPPGPTGFAFYREFFTAVCKKTTHIQFGKWAKQYGDVVYLPLPGSPIIVLNSSAAIREMYAGEPKHITNDRPPSFIGEKFFENCGMTFSPGGKVWRRMRQLFHSSLSTHIDGGQIIEATVKSELDNAISDLSDSSRDGSSVNVNAMVSKFLMSVLHSLLTGECPPTGSKTIELMTKVDHYMNAFISLDTDFLMRMFPYLRYVPGTYSNDWDHMSKVKADLVKIFYTDYKSTFQAGNGMVDKFMDVMSDENSLVTEKQVQAIIFEVIAAGYVTSLSVLLSLILILLHKPEVQTRLQEEIDSVLEGRPPCLKDRSSLPYSEACMLELMRFSSQLPTGLPHLATKDFEFQGWVIPKGAMIVSNYFFASHDERVWENPWEFKPERFLDDGLLLDPLSDIKQQFVSFGTGKRMCPGQNFAKSRIFMFITTLLQQFEFLPSGSEPLQSYNPYDWQPGLIITPGQLNCKIRRRNCT